MLTKEQYADLASRIESVLNNRMAPVEEKFDRFYLRAEPMVKAFENLRWLKSAVMGGAIFIAAVGGAAAAVKTFILKGTPN